MLDPERAALAESHLAGCPDCQAQSAALREVTETLRAEPAAAMPEAVAHRLYQVIAAENARRRNVVAKGNGQSAATVQSRKTLGTFGEDLKTPTKSRWMLPAVAAAAVAAVVGFGAYVISSSAGLNEPPVVAPINSSDLGALALALEQTSGGLSPHRFSHAWECAREVVDQRIAGIASSTVDGVPALLVYTKSAGSTQVTAVTGCRVGTPSAGPSAVLPR